MMFDTEVFKDMSIEELINMLAGLYVELEGVAESEARVMARAVARRALISEIQWVDDILDK